jgi:hypothetical protein
MKLTCKPRYDAESYSSYIERLAQSHLLSTSQLLCDLVGTVSSAGIRGDLDRFPSDQLVSSIADATGENSGGWADSNVPKFRFWVLAPKCRTSYCPQCFVRDLHQGEVPHFRQEWIGALVTHCSKHQSPLLDWPANKAGARILPRRWLGFGGGRMCSVEQMFWHDVSTLRVAGDRHDDDALILHAWLEYVRALQELFEGREEGPLIQRLGLPLIRSLFHIASWSRLDLSTARASRVMRAHVASAEPYFVDLDEVQIVRGFGSDSVLRLSPSVMWRRSIMLTVGQLLQSCGYVDGNYSPYGRFAWEDLWRAVRGCEEVAVSREAITIERSFSSQLLGCTFPTRIPRKNESIFLRRV